MDFQASGLEPLKALETSGDDGYFVFVELFAENLKKNNNIKKHCYLYLMKPFQFDCPI